MFFKRIIIICLFLLFAVSANTFCQQAQKPPMGWISYNSLGSEVQDDVVQANADYVDKILK